MIEHSRPWLTDADRDALAAVLHSRMLAQGARVAELEQQMAAWVGCEVPGVAAGSGAAAIHLALRALGIRGGAEVILPSYVCGSVRDAVISADATPILADVGAAWVATPEQYESRITSRTAALIVPHMYGIFADVASFRAFRIPVIEDCAQAIGEQGRRIEGDVAIFSFHPTKCLTTGEGGMLVSDDADLIARARRVRVSPFSDISAALGLSQLARYVEALRRRRAIAEFYLETLDGILPPPLTELLRSRSMFFRFPLLAEAGFDEYVRRFAESGVAVRRGVDRLLHRVTGESDAEYPNSTRLYERTVSLPIFPGLTEEERGTVGAAALGILGGLTI